MEEEPHPIELDDGNVAPVVENQAAAAQEEEGNERAGPSPEDVYNRIVCFEGILKEAIDDFKITMRNEFCDRKVQLGFVKSKVRRINTYAKREIDFAVGDTVVLLDERKIGKVTNVTKLYVDVLLDGEQNRNKTVRKKKSLLTRFYD